MLDAFRAASREAGGSRTIASLKRALLRMGVTSSAHVASGTPTLEGEAALRFDAAFDHIRALSAERIGDPWTSRTPEMDA